MKQPLYVLFLAAWCVLMAQMSLLQFASGRASVPGWESSDARRDADPTGFWFAWALTTGFAAMLAFVLARETARLLQAPPTIGGSIEWGWLALAIGTWMFLAWTWGRSGLPHTQWRNARRRWRLRERFVALTSDRATGIDEISFDELLDHADVEWLEDILLHLGVQSEPRNLARAIRDTDDSPAPTADTQADKT